MGFNPTPQLLAEFELWRLRDQWTRFNDERMNRFTIANNSLAALPLHFPNGKKGTYYRHTVYIPAEQFGRITVRGLESTGLTANIGSDGTLTIEGVPTESGDFEFTVGCLIPGWKDGDPAVSRKFNIAFNPDPRDLWKNIPVPDGTEYGKDDETCDYVCVPAFNGKPQKDIVAASKRGRSHAQEGKPRDDDFRIGFNGHNGWYVMAVADGAGSAQFSREGSRIACQTTADFCNTRLSEEGAAFENLICRYAYERSQETLTPLVNTVHSILVSAAREAYMNIRAEVERRDDGATMRDFSTTLLLTICRRFEFGWFVASFGVGDGAIAVYDRYSDTVRLLNEPDGGEYAGQTRFLTMESIFKDRTRIRLSIVPDFTALLMMTDGISDPFFETDANLSRKEKWDELWNNLNDSVDFSDDNEASRHQLLKWLDFWSPGNHDDRTIAILY